MAKMKPSDQQRLDLLNRLLKSCAETEELCRKLGLCNVNLDKESRMNKEQQQIAAALKRELYPNEV